MSAASQHVYESEMGFSHQELLKVLPTAVEPYAINRISSDRYSMTRGKQVANLYLGPEKIRKIASLQLPVTQITIEFAHFSEVQRTEFLERFKKYLHRGGG